MNDLPQSTNNQEAMAELWEVEPPRVLSNRARDVFLTLLDAEGEPNEALKAAAAEYRRGWREGEVYHFQPPTHNPNAGNASEE